MWRETRNGHLSEVRGLSAPFGIQCDTIDTGSLHEVCNMVMSMGGGERRGPISS